MFALSSRISSRGVVGLGGRRAINTSVIRQFVANQPKQDAAKEAPKPAVPLIELFVDGKAVKVPQGTALIQACEIAGVTIPRFCYHERLSIAGNCRQCLIEVEKSPKPVASCAMPAMPGMKVFTNSPLVKKAREGVMEFILANHPLDCPICDQGGECDLQDQSVRYGSDRGRIGEYTGKRAVEDKDLGPLVKTVMTRCIQCTRCVRFANEVAGVDDLGTSGRGNDIQIGTYVEKTLDSELSGNIVDLCPVGALTSKPYAFKARPWELRKTESIDVLDAIGSNIRVDSRGVEVMRVLPRLNEEVNQEWISDKTRYACDGLKRQRLTQPLVREGDTFIPVSWEQALHHVAEKLVATPASEATAIVGALADAESLVAVKDLFNRLGSEHVRLDGPAGSSPAPFPVDFRFNYTLNSTIAGIDQTDLILIVGANPKKEAPVFNARIRAAYLHNNVDIGFVGPAIKLNYDYDHIGTNAKAIEALTKGDHPFSARIKSAKKPLIVIGSALEDHRDARAIYGALAQLIDTYKDKFIQPSWNGVNVLQRYASRVAALDLGITSLAPLAKPASFVYLLNADEITAADIPENAFVVYQGHHGDVGANFADVILPGAAYTEKSATYVNTEGRPQITAAAVRPPGLGRDDWKIIRALSEVAGLTLPYDTVEAVRARLSDISPTFGSVEKVEKTSVSPLALKSLVQHTSDALKNTKLDSSPAFKDPVADFYLTDPISRASQTMAKCSAAFTHRLPSTPFKLPHSNPAVQAH